MLKYPTMISMAASLRCISNPQNTYEYQVFFTLKKYHLNWQPKYLKVKHRITDEMGYVTLLRMCYKKKVLFIKIKMRK